MKRAARQIAACAVLLIVFCVVCRLTVFRTYTVSVPLRTQAQRERPQDLQLDMENPDVAGYGQTDVRDGVLRIPIEAKRAGNAYLTVSDPNGDTMEIASLRVGKFLTVYNNVDGSFTGDTAVLIAVTTFWLLVSAIMMWHYFQAKGPDFYGYATIYFSGFSLFALATGGTMMLVTARHLLSPRSFSMLSAYRAICSAGATFMRITLPLIAVFALAMAVSNMVLLRHERFWLQNVLGILVAVLLMAGEALEWHFYSQDYAGSEWGLRVRNTFENVYATVFVYFECMLAGSVICGIKAARHRPAPDKDVIIILGCWFRKDGTLPPLLRGRVDCAVSFWRRQKELNGKEALLIPSGGQGRDEPMPEAEAMRRYLLTQGIPERLIHPEDQSKNTYQNMAYSRKIIQDVAPKGKIVFATTNYHVFRSGVWAAQAGLRAEGVGGKTKWWYWPNAFMRECVGLLKNRWKEELALLIALIVFFGLLSMIL